MAGACNQLIAKLRLFLGGGGVPLTLATAQPAPHAHMAVPECSLSGQAIAVSDVTPSPRWFRPLKPPGVVTGMCKRCFMNYSAQNSDSKLLTVDSDPVRYCASSLEVIITASLG